jgi:hypothetical protein
MRFLFYTLTLIFLTACGGGGGGSSSSASSTTTPTTTPATTPPTTTTPTTPVVLASQVTISSDITKNAYSTSYTATAQTPVVDDTCLLTALSISYPEPYKGTFPLPQVNGSFSNTNIALSIAPKDDWINSGGPPNPNLNKGCVTAHKDAFTSTLLRLKALGATYLTIYSSTRLDDASNPKVLAGYFISDSDLIWMGQQAANSGMKLRFTMQVDVWDQKGNDVYAAINKLSADQQQAWAINFLGLYKSMMLHEASVMATLPNSFDAIKLDWGYFDPAVFTNNKALKVNALVDISLAIRNIYNWKQFINHFSVTDFTVPNSNLMSGADLLVGSVDLIEVMPQNARPMTQDEENNLSVAFVKNFFNIVPNWILTLKKRVIWNIQVQSHRTFFTKGWIEDCCITPSYTGALTDFSVQAIGVEGMLEMIADKTRNGGVLSDSVNINSYWWTDTLTPHDGLPNISQSIRNKPAESIVYQWWKK